MRLIPFPNKNQVHLFNQVISGENMIGHPRLDSVQLRWIGFGFANLGSSVLGMVVRISCADPVGGGLSTTENQVPYWHLGF